MSIAIFARVIGMHALQLMPLGLLGLELLSRRVSALRSEKVRFRIVLVGSLAFAASVVILIVQALIGQSVAALSTSIVVASTATAAASVATVAAILVRGRRATLG